tara:strand:+ start:7004 stop:7537 length:534 start_codon:yes stop_codon:yes gene_type:complete
MLEIPAEVFKNRLINAYMYDEDVMKYKKDHLFIIHSNKQDNHFNVFEKYLEDRDNFVNSYDIVDTFFGVKVFSINEKYKNAYEAFKQGKYSSFDLISKGSCFKFGVMEDNRVLHHVFKKSDKLRELKEKNLGISLSKEQELWSIWNPRYDIITPDLKDYLRAKSKATSLSPNKMFNE